METGTVAEKRGELKLENLKTGIDDINIGYKLSEVISFINDLKCFTDARHLLIHSYSHLTNTTYNLAYSYSLTACG